MRNFALAVVAMGFAVSAAIPSSVFAGGSLAPEWVDKRGRADLVNDISERDVRNSLRVSFTLPGAVLPEVIDCSDLSRLELDINNWMAQSVNLDCQNWAKKGKGYLFRGSKFDEGGVTRVRLQQRRDGVRVQVRAMGPMHDNPAQYTMYRFQANVVVGDQSFCGGFDTVHGARRGPTMVSVKFKRAVNCYQAPIVEVQLPAGSHEETIAGGATGVSVHKVLASSDQDGYLSWLQLNLYGQTLAGLSNLVAAAESGFYLTDVIATPATYNGLRSRYDIHAAAGSYTAIDFKVDIAPANEPYLFQANVPRWGISVCNYVGWCGSGDQHTQFDSVPIEVVPHGLLFAGLVNDEVNGTRHLTLQTKYEPFWVSFAKVLGSPACEGTTVALLRSGRPAELFVMTETLTQLFPLGTNALHGAMVSPGQPLTVAEFITEPGCELHLDLADNPIGLRPVITGTGLYSGTYHEAQGCYADGVCPVDIPFTETLQDGQWLRCADFGAVPGRRPAECVRTTGYFAPVDWN